MAGIWYRMFGNRDPDEHPSPSPDVQSALDESAQRLAQAKRIRRGVAQDMAQVNRALAANGFAPAVLATFQRREHR
jgi:hypothetical protein